MLLLVNDLRRDLRSDMIVFVVPKYKRYSLTFCQFDMWDYSRAEKTFFSNLGEFNCRHAFVFSSSIDGDIQLEIHVCVMLFNCTGEHHSFALKIARFVFRKDNIDIVCISRIVEGGKDLDVWQCVSGYIS